MKEKKTNMGRYNHQFIQHTAWYIGISTTAERNKNGTDLTWTQIWITTIRQKNTTIQVPDRQWYSFESGTFFKHWWNSKAN